MCRVNGDLAMVQHRTSARSLSLSKSRFEIPVGADPDFALWVYELFAVRGPQMEGHHLA
jgi:hypothetical protein